MVFKILPNDATHWGRFPRLILITSLLPREIRTHVSFLDRSIANRTDTPAILIYQCKYILSALLILVNINFILKKLTCIRNSDVLHSTYYGTKH